MKQKSTKALFNFYVLFFLNNLILKKEKKFAQQFEFLIVP
jgi:hypothetical protein